MAAMFLAKRATINIYRASSLHRDYNNSARSIADGVTIISSSRYFASHVRFVEFFEVRLMHTKRLITK